jgi:hypothetical protein
MGDVVNLRRVRKRAAKQREDERAAENRIKHGRTRVERELGAKRSEQLNRHLDGHEIDTGDSR